MKQRPAEKSDDARPEKRRVCLRLIMCLLAGVITAGLYSTPFMIAFQNRLYDIRAAMLAKHVEPSSDIVVIEVDDRSLVQMADRAGRWPWPRGFFATLVERCSVAKTIAFDVIFSEENLDDPEGDRRFARAIEKHGEVVLSIHLDRDSLGNARSLSMDTRGIPNILPGVDWLSCSEALSPFDALLAGCKGIGFVNAITDADGAIRRATLLAALDGTAVPSLALASAMLFSGVAAEELEVTEHKLRFGDRMFTVDSLGRFTYLPMLRTYQRYSASDVIRGKIPQEEFDGKLVFVGSTATGLRGDVHVTPSSVSLPGVYLSAIAADGLLSGRCIRQLPNEAGLGIVLFMCVALALVPQDRPMPILLFSAGLFLSYAAIDLLVLFTQSLMLPLSTPLSAIIACTLLLGFVHWRQERDRRRQLERLEVAKQQYTDMLVHDLRTGVSPAVMALSLLQELSSPGGESERGEMLLASAQSSLSRVVGQISTLLDIRKMQEGRLTLARKEVHVGDLVSELADSCRPAARNADVEIEVKRGDVHELMVFADENILSRIVENLLWNAVGHASAGSEIVVALSMRSGIGVLSIANHGDFITREKMEEIFKPFVSMADSGKSKGLRGTGLGLAFCRIGCEAHGWTLKVNSPWVAPSDGAEFVVEFSPHIA